MGQTQSKKFKLLLVKPPFFRLQDIGYVHFELGLNYLASFCAHHGVDVKVYNMEVAAPEEIKKGYHSADYKYFFKKFSLFNKNLRKKSHLVWTELREVLLEFKPDLIGVSVMTNNLKSGLKVIELYKELFPEGKAVCGGPYATTSAEALLQHKLVDFAARGEAEHTLLELCRSLHSGGKNLASIDGLSYKEDSIHHSKDRDLVKDLDELSFPSRELNYFPERYDHGKLARLQVSRGCTYSCTFCTAPNIWKRRVRFRSADNVIKELEYLKPRLKGVVYIFQDDTFTLNKERTMELCNKMIERNLNVSWCCQTRADRLDPELVKVMKKSGLHHIYLGVESGSDRILRKVKKGMTVQQNKDAINLLKEQDIEVFVNFMIGLPDETEEDILKTKELIQELDVDKVNLFMYTPFPGTEEYEKIVNNGIVIPEEQLSSYALYSKNNCFTTHIPPKKFFKLRDQMIKMVDKKNKEKQLSTLPKHSFSRWKNLFRAKKVEY